MATQEQKQILQYLLYQPLVSAKEFEKVCLTVFQRQIQIEEIKEKEIKSLNELLQPAQLAIKSRLCEDSNDEYFALINLIESEAAKHTSEFSGPEFELFTWIMKEIVSSETGSVSSIDCINHSSNIPKLSKTDAQKVLDKFLTSHWLKEKEGEVSFTVRALLELEPLLKTLDDEIDNCKICGKIAVKRVVCSTESCGAKVHRFCLSRLSKATATLKCPVCSRSWTSSLDDETPRASASQTPTQTDQESGGGRRRTRVYTDSESD